MVHETRLRRMGGSIGATIPKRMCERLRLAAGDRMLVIETDRGLLLTPFDPDLEAGLAAAANVSRKFRSALRELGR